MIEVNKREEKVKQRLRERKEGGRKQGRTNKQVKKNQCKEHLGRSYDLFLG